MYDEIFSNLEKKLPNSELNELRNKNIHLGIFCEPYLTFMLEGKKIIRRKNLNKNLRKRRSILEIQGEYLRKKLSQNLEESLKL